MTLWKIVPVADGRDPRWQNHQPWQEVVVRAPTAAQARVLAAHMDLRNRADLVPAGNESLSFKSCFQDEKLYRVKPLERHRRKGLQSNGPDEVIEAKRSSSGEVVSPS